MLLEIEQFLVDDRIEALVGGQYAGCFLIGLFLFRIRLVPT